MQAKLLSLICFCGLVGSTSPLCANCVHPRIRPCTSPFIAHTAEHQCLLFAQNDIQPTLAHTSLHTHSGIPGTSSWPCLCCCCCCCSSVPCCFRMDLGHSTSGLLSSSTSPNTSCSKVEGAGSGRGYKRLRLVRLSLLDGPGPRHKWPPQPLHLSKHQLQCTGVQHVRNGGSCRSDKHSVQNALCPPQSP